MLTADLKPEMNFFPVVPFGHFTLVELCLSCNEIMFLVFLT